MSINLMKKELKARAKERIHEESREDEHQLDEKRVERTLKPLEEIPAPQHDEHQLDEKRVERFLAAIALAESIEG